jgi:hypothetical protein
MQCSLGHRRLYRAIPVASFMTGKRTPTRAVVQLKAVMPQRFPYAYCTGTPLPFRTHTVGVRRSCRVDLDVRLTGAIQPEICLAYGRFPRLVIHRQGAEAVDCPVPVRDNHCVSDDCRHVFRHLLEGNDY